MTKPASLRAIEKERLFFQIRYRDLLSWSYLISILKMQCEVYIAKDELYVSGSSKYSRIAKMMYREGMPMRVHAPVVSNSQDLRDSYFEILPFCRSFRVKNIIMHAESPLRGTADPEKWIDSVAPLWGDIAESARTEGINILLENYHETSPAPIVALIEHIGCESLKICVDVGHVHAFAGGDQERFLSGVPNDLIGEIHLSDNCGDEDAHLCLGEGTIKFKPIFDVITRRAIKPVYTIEALSFLDMIRGVMYLKKIKVL